MRIRSQRGAASVLLVIAFVVLGASGARSSERSAGWTWNVAVPGDVPSDSIASASAEDVRQVAAAGNFALVAASHAGQVLVGPVVAGRAELEPLDAVAADRPLVVFSAASVDAHDQTLVGMARADIDRVEATLDDGSHENVPLNEWRGFAYTAAAPGRAAIELAAYAGGSSAGAISLPQTTTPSSGGPSGRLYGIFRASFAAETIRVARVDSRTLQPRAGPSLQLTAQIAGPAALSPDERRLALVTSNATTSEPSRLNIIDLQSMRVLNSVSLPKNVVRGLSWPKQDRLIELRQTMGPPYNRNVRTRVAWVIDPDSGVRVGGGALTNKLAIRQSASIPAGLVLLLGTSGLHARADSQLALVSPDGDVKSVVLPLRSIKGGRLMSRLAVDTSTGHAYVIAPGGVVFDVDLTSMAVARHQLTLPTGAANIPAAIGIPHAETLRGKLAVAGVFTAQGGGPRQGVVLVDPSDWTTRLIDANASMFTTAGDRLLTYGPAQLQQGSAVSPRHDPVYRGVSVYDADGALITHLYGARALTQLLLTPGYGHVIYNGPSTVRLKQKNGPPRFIGNNDQLVFGLRGGAALGGGRISSATPPAGAPMLIFRGSAMLGEPSDRQGDAPTRAARRTASASSSPPRTPQATIRAPFPPPIRRRS